MRERCFETGELLLRDGDYVPDEKGGFLSVSGDEALLQRVLLRLTARRGAFPFLPDFGSRLYLLPRAKPGERASLAKQYCAEALAGEEGLEVTGVTLNETEPGRGTLTVTLNRQGRELSLAVEV